MMHPLQIAAYTFGVIDAWVCLAVFFYATRGSGLSIWQRVGLCAICVSAAGYLVLRAALIYLDIH